MTGSDSASIARRLAQRRVALLLLPLRLWIGLAWLRSGLANALQPEWLDGTALTGLVERHVDAGTTPLPLYTDLLSDLVGRAAGPLGIALVCAQVAIGILLLTGTLTNLALLTAILLNTGFILAGAASPSQFHLVIEVVLLAGGAGAAYSVDRGLSRYLPSVVLTGHRGLVDGVEMPRSVLLILAVAAGGLAAALVPTVGAVLPEQGADDPGFVLVGLLSLIALLAATVTRSTHRAEDPYDARFRMDDPLGVGYPPAGAAPSSGPLPPPRPRPPRPPTGDPLPVPGPPPGHPADPLRAPIAQPDRAPGRWPSRAPAPAAPPARPAPAARDQPTTQFARPRRRRVADRRPPVDDPYAELRDLPPHHQ